MEQNITVVLAEQKKAIIMASGSSKVMAKVLEEAEKKILDCLQFHYSHKERAFYASMRGLLNWLILEYDSMPLDEQQKVQQALVAMEVVLERMREFSEGFLQEHLLDSHATTGTNQQETTNPPDN